MYNDPNQPQQPYGQPPNYQNPYEQPQQPYGQPPGYQNPYEQPPYGQPQQPYGQSSYDQPPAYAPTQYGPSPYGAPPAPGYAQPQQPKKSNRWLWITLGIIGGLVLLGCVGCALVFGLIGKGVQQTVSKVEQTATAVSGQGAQITAQAYYAAIQAQDYTTAYSYLDSGLVASNNQPLTQDLYTQAAQGRDTSLGRVTNYSISADPNDPNSITVSVTRSQGSTYTVHLKFTQTSDGWKITSYDEI